jgi:hypothetical protein
MDNQGAGRGQSIDHREMISEVIPEEMTEMTMASCQESCNTLIELAYRWGVTR